MSIKLCLKKFKFYNSDILKNNQKPHQKVIISPIYIVDMQEKIKGAHYIIRKIHVKPINVTPQPGANSLKIFADMETPTFSDRMIPRKQLI